MSTPFYVSPEQVIKDKADYARKGIARGRSVVVLEYAEGICMVAENPSRALHKISEIYDRIAFAAVGKYNEFENLRVAGVRLADLRGYSYARRDVTARGLANAYAQTLGSIFTETNKPYEVEIVVAEIGDDPSGDSLYRLRFDGSVADEQGYVAMGGSAEAVSAALQSRWQLGLALAEAVSLAVSVLAKEGAPDGTPEDRVLEVTQLEVAILERGRPRRTFRRIEGEALRVMLPTAPTAAATDSAPPDAPVSETDSAPVPESDASV